MISNKKGSSVGILFFIIIASVTIIIVGGVLVYGLNQIVLGLTSTNSMVGAVNLTTATQQTLGQINTALINNANLYGVILIFGMFLGMMIGGFVIRDKFPKILFVFDIFILIFAYIIAVYLSNAYETAITSIPFSSIYTGTMPTASAFVLKLPFISLIAGAITIILSYSAIPRNKEEQIAGY